MTKQPDWKFIANIGDANPVDEGGIFVYEDATGVYPPEAEVLDPHRYGKWHVYRVVLAKCTFVDGVLSDNKHHPDKPAWFADRIDRVARAFGNSDVIELLCSDAILDRARGYQMLWVYCGLDNFDSSPRVIDPFKELYSQGELGRCRK